MVNDGSRDQTWETIKSMVKQYKELNMVGVNYKQNGGKGFAVRTGMRNAKGKYVLMVDADGATDVKEIKKFVNIMNEEVKLGNKNIVLVGSRKLETENVQRDLIRAFLSSVNSFFVKVLIGIKNIKDTQCGFKMFTQSANQYLCSKMHLNRWAFDVELFYIAQG